MKTADFAYRCDEETLTLIDEIINSWYMPKMMFDPLFSSTFDNQVNEVTDWRIV